MNIFCRYAYYYDLLYRDKDYAGEAQFIHRLVQKYAPNAQNILELGCGTGNHAVLLAQKGYEIHGVDFSRAMLKKANNRLSQLPDNLASQLKFSYGDIRNTRLKKSFDVVVSLFHVINYQTTNEDLQAAFSTVKEHLKPGGIFIFDSWYGPAVLTEGPTVRVKRLEDDKIGVTRIAEPVVLSNENLVDVNYHILIRDKSGKAVEELHETHRMRYLFKPEIDLLLKPLNLQIIAQMEWMSGKPLGLMTWNSLFIVH